MEFLWSALFITLGEFPTRMKYSGDFDVELSGFTDEELDFIINYDIKYRMGTDLDEAED